MYAEIFLDRVKTMIVILDSISKDPSMDIKFKTPALEAEVGLRKLELELIKHKEGINVS